MTPEQKAESLVDSIYEIIGSTYSGYYLTACGIAVFTVKEIKSNLYEADELKYWEDVIKEIREIEKKHDS